MTVKESIFPLPASSKPIAVLSFVQLYVMSAPSTIFSVDELNSMSKVSSPLQSTCEGIGSISIVGFTVTITSKLSPTQPLYFGVTVYVIVATFSEEFIRV